MTELYAFFAFVMLVIAARACAHLKRISDSSQAQTEHLNRICCDLHSLVYRSRIADLRRQEEERRTA